MANNKKVTYTVKLKDDTKKGAKSVENSMTKLGKTLGPLVTASFGVAAIKAATDAYIRQENAIAQLDQRLKSTGGTVGFVSEELQDMAASLQKVTTFGDEATIEMQSLLLTFTQIRGPIFQQAQESILNVATALGTDLKSAAIQVGKALNDPKGQLSALSRSGIQFTETQKEQIKTMQEAGDVAGAQTVILKELETQFGGAARAARDTLGGAITSLSNVMGDLGETVIGKGSGALGVVGGMNALTSALSDLNEEIANIDIDALDLFMFALNPAGAAANLVAKKISGIGSPDAQQGQSFPITRPTASGGGADPTQSIFGYTQEEAADAMLVDQALFLADKEFREVIALDSASRMKDLWLIQAEDKKAIDEASFEHSRFLDMSRLQMAESSANSLISLQQSVFTISGKKSEELFRVTQAVGAATAVVHMWQGVAAGVKLGYPAAIPAVAAALAQGGIAIANITSQSPTGGKSGSGTATGFTPSNAIQTQPVVDIPEPQKALSVTIVGNVIGEDEWVENNLIPAINAASDRNVTLNIGATA